MPHTIQLVDPNSVDMKDVIVFNVSQNLGNKFLLSALHPEQDSAQRRAIQTLEKAGATVRSLNMPELTEKLNAFSIWSAMMDRESPKPFDEIIREGLGMFNLTCIFISRRILF